MCRHLAYLGPPVELATLLFDPPHSLLRQSFAPADMRGGAILNADGFGAGWYPVATTPGRSHIECSDVSGVEVKHPEVNAVLGNAVVGNAVVGNAVAGDGAPTRYRRAVPMWTDSSFAALARAVHSGAVLAAVRSATEGMPVIDTACAPFTTGRWLFSHNGMITGWPGSIARLAAQLPVTDLLTLDAPTDSALLWALVRHRLAAGESPECALCAVTAEVLVAAPDSRLNLLLTDGTVVAATAVYHALWVRAGDGEVLVSSEPTDQAAGWEPVPEGHLLIATKSTVDIKPIPC